MLDKCHPCKRIGIGNESKLTWYS